MAQDKRPSSKHIRTFDVFFHQKYECVFFQHFSSFSDHHLVPLFHEMAFDGQLERKIRLTHP